MPLPDLAQDAPLIRVPYRPDPARQAEHQRTARFPSAHAPRLHEINSLGRRAEPALLEVGRRGDVIEAVTLSGRSFIEFGAALWKLGPIRTVRLRAIAPYMTELAAAPHLANVERLDLQGNRIGSAGFRALASSPNLGALRALDLSRNNLDDNDAEALFAELSHLTDVRLSGNRLRRPLALGRCTTVDLSDNPFDDSPIRSGTPNIVSVANTAIPETALDFLRELPLTHLIVAGIPLPTGLLPFLVSLPATLERLDISFCRVKELGIAVGRSSVAVLRARGNRLTAEECRAIAHVCPNLREFDAGVEA